MDGLQWACEDDVFWATVTSAPRMELSGNSEPNLLDSRTDARTASREMFFVLDLHQDVQKDVRMARLHKLQNLRAVDSWMASSPKTSHPPQGDASLEGFLDVPDPAEATILPIEVQNAKEPDSDETNVIVLLKEKKFKAYMFVRLMSNMSRLSVSVFDTGSWPNLVRTSFLLVEWRSGVRPMHKMSLKSTSSKHVKIIGKIMLSVQMGHLYVGIPFSVMQIFAVKLLIGTSYTDRFVSGMFPIERRVVLIPSFPVKIISGHRPPSDPLAVSHNDSEAESVSDE